MSKSHTGIRGDIMFCSNCGDEQSLNLPQPVKAAAEAMIAFDRKHCYCLPDNSSSIAQLTATSKEGLQKTLAKSWLLISNYVDDNIGLRTDQGTVIGKSEVLKELLLEIEKLK